MTEIKEIQALTKEAMENVKRKVDDLYIRLEKITAERDQYKAIGTRYSQHVDSLLEERQDLIAHRQTLLAALEFYADQFNKPTWAWLTIDGGKTAREAIAKVKRC